MSGVSSLACSASDHHQNTGGGDEDGVDGLRYQHFAQAPIPPLLPAKFQHHSNVYVLFWVFVILNRLHIDPYRLFGKESGVAYGSCLVHPSDPYELW